MGARHFSEIVAWQLCAQLRDQLLAVVARPQVARDFKYCNQVLDAARSATSNIAEGFGRYSHAEFGQFLDVSLGSLGELQNLLDEARVRRFVTEQEFSDIWHLSMRACKATSALRRSLGRRKPPPPRPYRRPPRPRT